MPCTNPGLASRLDLTTVRYVLAEQGYVLVVYGVRLVNAEGAYFLSFEPEAPSASRSRFASLSQG